MSKYVIVDLEMCRVSRHIKCENYKYRSELIQIGAVLLDEDMNISGNFSTFVSPEYGSIDNYIERLTGISPMDVQGAPKFSEALEMFVDWLPSDAVLVSWSENDENQIRKEMEAKAVVIDGLDYYLENWVDCQETFAKKMDAQKKYKLSEALIIADINFEDGEHNALIDAQNTARLFIKMQHEPELVLNSHYSNARERSTFCPFAELLKNYSLAC